MGAHLADDEYASLAKRRGELIDSALADLRARVPAVRGYTPAQLDTTVGDLGYLIDFLAAGVYVDDASLFTEFVDWLAASWPAGGCPRRRWRSPWSTTDVSCGTSRARPGSGRGTRGARWAARAPRPGDRASCLYLLHCKRLPAVEREGPR
ncbi:hypothetical protein [Micromonospora sp. NPDC048830]|uniref:hypothetical protein n=1 Tax=Micromonospora sp. NPDC048830 TaxID=3364257 RepID=UPI00371D2568